MKLWRANDPSRVSQAALAACERLQAREGVKTGPAWRWSVNKLADEDGDANRERLRQNPAK